MQEIKFNYVGLFETNIKVQIQSSLAICEYYNQKYTAVFTLRLYHSVLDIGKSVVWYLHTHIGRSLGAQDPSAWQNLSSLPTNSNPSAQWQMTRQPYVQHSPACHPCAGSAGGPQVLASRDRTILLVTGIMYQVKLCLS